MYLCTETAANKFMDSYYLNLLLNGLAVFNEQGIDGSKSTNLISLEKRKALPAIFYQDSELPESNNGIDNPMKAFEESPTFRYLHIWELTQRMDDFFSVRGL
jgi:hypothetical protein